MQLCSGTFRKAVAESMGATGVIVAEYREKLDELSGRLGLSLEASKLMFHAAIRQRMAPLMQQVGCGCISFSISMLTHDI